MLVFAAETAYVPASQFTPPIKRWSLHEHGMKLLTTFVEKRTKKVRHSQNRAGLLATMPGLEDHYDLQAELGRYGEFGGEEIDPGQG